MLADLRKQGDKLEITVISGNLVVTAIKHRVKTVLWNASLGISKAI
jgi:ketopantoate reductase